MINPFLATPHFFALRLILDWKYAATFRLIPLWTRLQLALRQQGVGTDGLANHIDGLEHHGKHFDLIGLLGLAAACSGQGVDFFWVWH